MSFLECDYVIQITFHQLLCSTVLLEYHIQQPKNKYDYFFHNNFFPVPLLWRASYKCFLMLFDFIIAFHEMSKIESFLVGLVCEDRFTVNLRRIS